MFTIAIRLRIWTKYKQKLNFKQINAKEKYRTRRNWMNTFARIPYWYLKKWAGIEGGWKGINNNYPRLISSHLFWGCNADRRTSWWHLSLREPSRRQCVKRKLWILTTITKSRGLSISLKSLILELKLFIMKFGV